MDNLLSRHRNLTVLVVVLSAQVIGLAVQVKRPAESGSARLIRLWTVSAITPLEKGVVHTREWARNTWHNYFYLRDVRKENDSLRQEIERMRLQQVRLAEDAGQARRLQALLGFKEQFIQQTLPAQVISTTGSEFSRGIYIDKGAHDGLRPDMPVMTPDGIVGKVFKVYPTSSLVLVIDDPTSGVGVILEKSRLQGIVKGTAGGETLVHNIMSDEKVEVGERVLTSGGDRIYPKGLPIGVVSSVATGPDFFLMVRVKPAAQLSRLEEVLVITKVVEKTPDNQDLGPRTRAADILADRLPSVPPKPPELTSGAKPAGAAANPTGATAVPNATATTSAPGSTPKPAATVAVPPATKPSGPAPVPTMKPSNAQPQPAASAKPADKPVPPAKLGTVPASGKPNITPATPGATVPVSKRPAAAANAPSTGADTTKPAPATAAPPNPKPLSAANGAAPKSMTPAKPTAPQSVKNAPASGATGATHAAQPAANGPKKITDTPNPGAAKPPATKEPPRP